MVEIRKICVFDPAITHTSSNLTLSSYHRSVIKGPISGAGVQDLLFFATGDYARYGHFVKMILEMPYVLVKNCE
jgi:hypothetical protein